MNATHAVP